MKHLTGCPWLTGASDKCQCAETIYLATASDEERREFEAASRKSGWYQRNEELMRGGRR